jgi:methionine-gamma-lyase
MPHEHHSHSLQTRLIHLDRDANDTAAVSPPIFQTSTFLLGTPEQGAELAAQVAPAAYYTRYGSPNTKQVEALLANL